jgi:hypothetical protein
MKNNDERISYRLTDSTTHIFFCGGMTKVLPVATAKPMTLSTIKTNTQKNTCQRDLIGEYDYLSRMERTSHSNIVPATIKTNTQKNTCQRGLIGEYDYLSRMERTRHQVQMSYTWFPLWSHPNETD